MARILFCDDSSLIRKIITVALRSSPHEVFFAVDGEEGLVKMEELHPDLLCTDIAMPGMNGLELMDAVRARPLIANTPIIVLTASAQRQESDEALARGAVECVAKPFDVAFLRERIEFHIQSSLAKERD